MGDLALELSARGMPGTILTARWRKDWPQTVTFHGMRVHRLAEPPPQADTSKAHWATTYYIRAIAAWLRRNYGSYDVVIVSGLRHEANAAILALADGSGVPIILRGERPGRRGDCLWQLEAPGGLQAKQRAMRAGAFVAPSRQIHHELIAAGYDRGRIHYIPHGTRIEDCRQAKNERQTKARAVLADASPALQMPSWAPLAVFTGRLAAENRLDTLVAAWPEIVSRWPNARLWLAGDGPEKLMLQAQITNLNLADRVRLVGTFDCVDDLFRAADVFIHPARDEDLSVAMLEAMAAGLPVIAADNRSNRELITHADNGLLFESQTAETDGGGAYPTLSKAVFNLLDNPDQARRMGQAGRDMVAERFNLDECVDSYENLLRAVGCGGPCPIINQTQGNPI